MINEKLKLEIGVVEKIVRFFFNKKINLKIDEFAVWITNGIKEFENYKDIELHVIFPYPHLKQKVQEFVQNNIFYHCFHNEDDDLLNKFYKSLFRINDAEYLSNRRLISTILKNIKPDIIHFIGAENPYYALSILDVPKNIPTIIQLQTLINNPNFEKNYPISHEYYNFLKKTEKKILERADFIGTTITKYKDIIKNTLVPNANFLDLCLTIGEEINTTKTNKEFDFVYFANNINKAVDFAIQAFAIVHKINPEVTLDIVGGFDINFKIKLDKIIYENKLENVVFFEGKLPTHEDVLKQIRKSKFALLPLKIDLISCTVREAMANGLPVITTDTGESGTQKLNNQYQSVLISPIGDCKKMAENMLMILNNNKLVDSLCKNAYKTITEYYSNKAIIQKYIRAYKDCLENFKK